MALLVVLVLLVLVGGSSSSFIWFMNQQQFRAGARYRSMAAMAAAEAGVHRAMLILETVNPDGRAPGRAWRPIAYTEPVRSGPLAGRFTLSLDDDTGGAIVITSVGEVAGATRRLRARVYLSSPALLAALYGAGFVRLEKPPAATVVLPYGDGIGDRPWIHIAAGRGIWFASTDVSINEPFSDYTVDSGPVDHPAGSIALLPRPSPVRVLLARGAQLMLGQDQQRADVVQLRAAGVYVEGAVLQSEALPEPPEVNRFFYKTQAAANLANAGLNEAAGQYLGDKDLARKSDSLYTGVQFERLQRYLNTGTQASRFSGVIYVMGRVALFEGQQMHIADGALIAESSVLVGERALLGITHTGATRTLPGVIVLDPGALVVSRGARLRAHGLVYAGRVIEIGDGARVDIVGSVIGNDGSLSFRSYGASVVIRYDPAVLGTPGLRLPLDAAVVGWVAAWEELP